MTGKWLTINRGNQHSLRKIVILWLVSWRLIGHLLAGTNLFFHVIYLAGKKWILIPSFSHLFLKNNYKMNLEMGEVDGWIPDWFPKVEKEESRKWEPVLREESKRQTGKSLKRKLSTIIPVSVPQVPLSRCNPQCPFLWAVSDSFFSPTSSRIDQKFILLSNGRSIFQELVTLCRHLNNY